MTTAAPTTLDALAAAVAESGAAPLVVAGARTKRPAPDTAAPAIDLTALTGIVGYDPAECVATVRAGTRVSQLVERLSAHGQYLPWDPPLVEDGATVGGMIASGWNGPGRYRYGGMRDFVLGARMVDGRGRLITSGGQVVKNAAGFLLHHALVGSAGRLGAIGEISVKVFPRAEASATLVAPAAAMADALAAHERLRCDGLELDALDLIGTPPTVLARLSGAATALPARLDRARRALALDADAVSGDDERAVWRRFTDGRPPAGATLVKLPSTPTRLEGVARACAGLASWRASCGGAAVYAVVEASLAPLDAALLALGVRGVAIAGLHAGQCLGPAASSPFADRVRATLDPDGRFR